MAKLYLVDGHAYLHRAYHALPPLTTSQGQPVNAIYGFIRMLWKIIKQEKPDYLVVCFDTAAPTFRHEAHVDYKATRKPLEDALASQMPLAREAVHAMNIAAWEQDGFEADDLIAQLTRSGRKEGWDVVIVSADKDMLQLVDEHVNVLSEPKNVLFDTQKVKEKYGLGPKQLPDMFALIGDISDNVPGVAGIGPKTAVKLIEDYGDLEAVLKAAPELKGKVGELLQTYADEARRSRSLVILDQTIPVTLTWDQCERRPPVADQLIPFLKRLEFNALIDEFLPRAEVAVDTSKKEYRVLSDEASLEKWVTSAAPAEILVVEPVTSTTDPLHSDLIGLALSIKAGSAVYLPFKQSDLADSRILPLAIAQKHLPKLLSGSGPRLYGHDLKATVLVLKRHALTLGKLSCDTMVASYVLNPSRTNQALKDVVLDAFGERVNALDQLTGKGLKQLLVDQIPLEKMMPFACANADWVFQLAERFLTELQKNKLDKLFSEVEMPLISVLADMEEQGIRLDVPYLVDLGKVLQSKMNALETAIYDHAGGPFNINSPKQLSTILFEKLKLPVIRRTKTGFSTDEEVLQTLSASHPLPAALIEYRELQKLKSTYVDGLQAKLHTGEDRIHTDFNQTVTATGRLSSSNPNLQNIPVRTELGREIRKTFIPDKGCLLVSADYSQIDLRVLAHISQDKTLCEAFRKGEDIHTLTACEMFNIMPNEMTPDLRRVAKSINFGIVYGISAFGLSQSLQIPTEKAKDYIDKYFLRYPGVKAWIHTILEEARREGAVRTLLGRIRYLPEIQSKNAAVRGFAERTAMNTPIQGTSADIIKIAMLHVDEARAKKHWTGKMLLQVHDELVFEIPEEQVADSAQKIRVLMENALPLSIPVIVDLKTGRNWAEMKPLAPSSPAVSGRGSSSAVQP